MVNMIIIDLETSGLNPKVNGIHQIAAVRMLPGIAGWSREVDSEAFNRYCNLYETDQWSIKPGCTSVRITEEEARYGDKGGVGTSRINPLHACIGLVDWLTETCDPYDPQDKMWLAEWGNGFDSNFLHPWWALAHECDAVSFHPGNFFRRPSINLMSVCQYLCSQMLVSNWKLENAADLFDVDYEYSKLHDAQVDAILTAKVLMAAEARRYR